MSEPGGLALSAGKRYLSGMAKETSRRQLAHQAKLKASGIKRVSVWLPIDLQEAINARAESRGESQHGAMIGMLRDATSA